jgi:NADP-dependent 3-hydroxy acid dehydrogenase YdfG
MNLSLRLSKRQIPPRPGQVNILYANAPVTRFAPVETLTFADWKWNVEHEMDVVFLPVKYFWPQLIKAPNAAIVLVGSTAGVIRVHDQRPAGPHRHKGCRGGHDQTARG